MHTINLLTSLPFELRKQIWLLADSPIYSIKCCKCLEIPSAATLTTCQQLVYVQKNHRECIRPFKDIVEDVDPLHVTRYLKPATISKHNFHFCSNGCFATAMTLSTPEQRAILIDNLATIELSETLVAFIKESNDNMAKHGSMELIIPTRRVGYYLTDFVDLEDLKSLSELHGGEERVEFVGKMVGWGLCRLVTKHLRKAVGAKIWWTAKEGGCGRVTTRM